MQVCHLTWSLSPPHPQRPCKIRLFVTRQNEKSIIPWQMVPNTLILDKHRNLTFDNLFYLMIFNCCQLLKHTKATATFGKKSQLYLHLTLQYSPNNWHTTIVVLNKVCLGLIKKIFWSFDSWLLMTGLSLFFYLKNAQFIKSIKTDTPQQHQ